MMPDFGDAHNDITEVERNCAYLEKAFLRHLTRLLHEQMNIFSLLESPMLDYL